MKPEIANEFTTIPDARIFAIHGKCTVKKVFWQERAGQLQPDSAVFISLPDKTAEQVIETGYCSVEVIDDTAGFEAMKTEWDELLMTTPVDTLFLSWDWLYTWWCNLGDGRKLHIIAVRQAGRLVAIAPLCQHSRLPGPIAPFQTLEFLGVGNVGSDYPDLIIRPDAAHSAMHALVKYLGGLGLIMDFSQVRSTSIYMSALRAGLEKQGWRVRDNTSHVCPYINLSGIDWVAYLDARGNSHRYNFRRRLKNLQKQFTDVRLEQVESEGQISTVFLQLVQMHNLRWDERGGSDAFHRTGLLNFHADMTARAAQQGYLRLYVLSLDSQVAAILYGFNYRKRFYYYQSAFDGAMSSYSPGLVIMGLVIQRAIEEGVQEFDFLHGDEEYKYRWASQQHELMRINLVPPGIKGTVYLRMLSTIKILKTRVRRFIPRRVIIWIGSRK